MIRLDKLLSHGGLGSRSSVKKLLRSGAVTVNGNSVSDASMTRTMSSPYGAKESKFAKPSIS